jgi:hypothetical protein
MPSVTCCADLHDYSLYFQSCSHYLVNNIQMSHIRLALTPLEQDFWRMSVSASQACQLLITWYVFHILVGREH